MVNENWSENMLSDKQNRICSAKGLFEDGYNCAQSVFCVFCEDFGIDFETGLKLSSSFGGGMGRLREVCGAVSAMFMIAGLKFGYSSNNDDLKKSKHYELIQKLADEFAKNNGSIICRELIGEDRNGYIPEMRTKKYYQKRPCAELVASAEKIIRDKILNE